MQADAALAGEYPIDRSAFGSREPALVWAATIGCRVPRTSCQGRVDAVFAHTCNVALATGGLVTVLAHHAGDVAHGIRLARDQRLRHGLRPGMPASINRDRVNFNGGTLTVMLSAARTWTPELQAGMCGGSGRAWRAASHVRRLLCTHAADCGSEFLGSVLDLAQPATPLAARISAMLPRFAKAVRARERTEALSLIARFIGLGPGLTPAGDDFVVGWLAGLTLCANTPAELDFLQAMCAGVADVRHTTTSVSRQHLEDACALLFSRRLSDVCVAIAQGESKPELALRVSAQIAVGATSGADAAAGLMFALFECGSMGRRSG